MYEDADFEDLTHAELRRVFWQSAVPTAKKEACYKHAYRELRLIDLVHFNELMHPQKTSGSTSANGGSIDAAVGTGTNTSSSSSSSSAGICSSGVNASSSSGSSSSSSGSGGIVDHVGSVGITNGSSSSSGSSSNKGVIVTAPQQVFRLKDFAVVKAGAGAQLANTNNSGSMSGSNSSGSTNVNTAVSFDKGSSGSASLQNKDLVAKISGAAVGKNSSPAAALNNNMVNASKPLPRSRLHIDGTAKVDSRGAKEKVRSCCGCLVVTGVFCLI